MDCIFCRKGNSFKTVEHVIPESLGNVDHVLPKGVVCDACNNYFAVKVEKPLLEMPYFINLRQRNLIRSKKRRLVPDKVLFPHPQGGWAEVWIDEQGFILRSEDTHIASLIKEGKINSMIIPTIPEVDYPNAVISRFLAKAALESVAYYSFGKGPYTDDFIEQNNLDPLREYARYGIGPFWPYHQRRIYTEEDRFVNTDIQPGPYEILHEFDFLMIDYEHIYLALVIMGVEYVIRMNQPEIETYQQWLAENKGRSPIRRGKEFMVTKDKNDGTQPDTI
jgi:hypothetical protein